MNTNQPAIIQGKKELDEIYQALNLKSIKYLPSPKAKNSNISEIANHAISMLKIYKQYKEGDNNAPIREIFQTD